MKSLIMLKIKTTRINQLQYTIISIFLLILTLIPLTIFIKEKNHIMFSILYLIWSFTNSILLRLRANDMDDFKTTNLDEMNISFLFGSVMPILNLGIIFYYATSKSK